MADNRATFKFNIAVLEALQTYKFDLGEDGSPETVLRSLLLRKGEKVIRSRLLQAMNRDPRLPLKAENSQCLNVSHWMTDIHEFLEDRTLYELSLVGSHSALANSFQEEDEVAYNAVSLSTSLGRYVHDLHVAENAVDSAEDDLHFHTLSSGKRLKVAPGWHRPNFCPSKVNLMLASECSMSERTSTRRAASGSRTTR